MSAPEPTRERRRADALRAAAGALDTLNAGTVDDLLRVAEWVLDEHRPEVERLGDQLHHELAEVDAETAADETEPAERPSTEPQPIGHDLARLINQHQQR